MIIFDSCREDGITGEPQTSSELRAADRCLLTKTCLMQQGPSGDGPQIEALSQRTAGAPSCTTSVCPSCDQCVARV